jgi:divalent metal cation (Fe/Co/Zn/Cd) transporter
VLSVPKIQLRWVGHRLQGAATLVLADIPLSAADEIVHEAQHQIAHALPNLDEMTLKATSAASASMPHSHH